MCTPDITRSRLTALLLLGSCACAPCAALSAEAAAPFSGSPASFYLAQAEPEQAAGTEPDPAEDLPNGEEGFMDKAKRGLDSVMEHEITRTVVETGKSAVEQSRSAMKRLVGSKTSRQNRAESSRSLYYMPIDYGLLMPAKTGVSGSWAASERWSIEPEYLSGGYGLDFLGVDLVDLSESVLSINARRWFGNSFNVKIGFGERKYEFKLGSKYLEKISDGALTERKLLRVRNNVVTLGLGNRWQYDSGFTFGLDYLELIIPVGDGSVEENFLQQVSDEDEKDDIQEVIDYMRDGLTFNLVKLHVGYAF